MPRTTAVACFMICFSWMLLAQKLEPPSPIPLRQAHAHNDYEHPRPLFDALDNGFCSVEADIHLIEGELLVAHDRKDVNPARTLRHLYLVPLRDRALKNNGRIYPGGPTILLLIDVKTEADSTYRVLREQLEEFADILSRFEGGRVERKAVTAVITGNRARDRLTEETVRYAALDGRFPDLETDPPVELVPLISENWRSHFTWLGEGAFPEEQHQKLLQTVQRAHQQGREIRFWGTPDRIELWRALRRARVDWINTDNLSGLRKFLLQGTADSPR